MEPISTPSRHPRVLMISLFSLLTIVSLLFAACGGTTTSSSTPTPTKGSGAVQVMYAGSLESIMEKQLGPAFQQSTGYTFSGEAKGSSALATEIKGKLRRPDIFISASAGVDKQLMGADNGNYVSWYVNFVRSQMVIGYNPNSKFAADFQAAANGSKPWYQVLEESGLRLGRTDPVLDPKGLATIYTMELAETYYNQPGLRQTVLGADENASQVFPEEDLVARLGAGQLDAGFFYSNEAKAANIPAISLPDQVNLGNPSMTTDYAKATWTNPKTNTVSKGAPIVFTVTIPSTVQNQAGAQAFVKFLLTSQGQNILLGNGLLSTPFKASGDAKSVPQTLQSYIKI